jgi:glyoxylase-like metal-dependent hydrolase (beta-lactamase superfamily II)
LEIQIIDTGYSEVPEALVVYGGSWKNKKRYRHAAIRIVHPNGTVVFDGGLGAGVSQEFAQTPRYMRLSRHFILEKPLVRHPVFQDPKSKIDFFLLSHGHWDHVSGMLDFPGIPIRMLPEEMSFLLNTSNPLRHGIFPAQVERIRERIQPLVLQEKPYENFSRSLDLFHDGSLVAVPLTGHTPGSLGLFINLPDGSRFLLVGDAVHGIHPDGSPEGRTRLMEILSDDNNLEARKTRAKLAELIAHSNEVKLVPTHEPDLLIQYLQKSGEPL